MYSCFGGCPSTFKPRTRDTRPYRVDMCGRQKLEPQNKKELVCNIKNCVIFGGHDTTPFPDYPCPARKIKIKDANKNSMGFPVGLVASNINFKSEGKPADIVLARYCTYLKAFARLHLNPETMWNPTLLDDLLREGLALYTASVAEEIQAESPPEIYSVNERKILREFEMSNCKFHVELVQKFRPEYLSAGAKGDGIRTDVPLTEFKPALKAFFQKFKHCLINIGTLYQLIWRARNAYFVLDVCGRRLEDFTADRDKGIAMLFCLKTLENVRHLILTLSTLPKVENFTIREIKMVKVITPTGATIQRDFGTRTHEFEIINDDYAYLKAALHLTLNREDLMRNRSAFPAGVAAFVASKIDHPATWNSKMLGKLICFGVNFCQCCWYKCLANEPIHVEEFPTLFHMGQFKINIDLVPRKYEGKWHCVVGYKETLLARSIEKAFQAGETKLLLQINYQMYGILKKNNYIYLFDPYRHRILGKPGEPEVYDEMEKSATMRMFRSFDVFLNTLNHILLDSNRSSQFYIHTVKIKRIQLKSEPEEEVKLEIDGEVKSLNEHICFDEAEELCHKALGEISDYEDEDLQSDVDELELRTSSSEPDVIGEEEGGEEGLGGFGGGGTSSRKKRKSAPQRKSAGSIARELDRLLTDLNDLPPDERAKRLETMDPKQRKLVEAEQKRRQKKIDNLLKQLNSLSPEEKKKKLAAMDPEERKALEDEEKRREKKYNKIKNDLSSLTPEEKKKRLKAMDPAERKSMEEEEKQRNKKNSNILNELSTLSPEAKKKRLEAMSTEERKSIEEEEKKRQNKDNSVINDINNLSPDERKKKLDAMDPAERKTLEAEENRRGSKYDNIISELNKLSPEERQKKLAAMDPAERKAIEAELEKRRLRDENRTDEEKQKLAALAEETQPKVQEDKPVEETKMPEKDIAPLRKSRLKDGTEADDECEDDFMKAVAKRFCTAPNSNRYPGYCKCPVDMAVVGSENGSYESLEKLLEAGFMRADRILTMTPWGTFVVFRCMPHMKNDPTHYYLFDGCTCNVNRFRHLDLSIGTAGLLCFQQVHDVIEYMRRSRKNPKTDPCQAMTAESICAEYCQ